MTLARSFVDCAHANDYLAVITWCNAYLIHLPSEQVCSPIIEPKGLSDIPQVVKVSNPLHNNPYTAIRLHFVNGELTLHLARRTSGHYETASCAPFTNRCEHKTLPEPVRAVRTGLAPAARIAVTPDVVQELRAEILGLRIAMDAKLEQKDKQVTELQRAVAEQNAQVHKSLNEKTFLYGSSERNFIAD